MGTTTRRPGELILLLILGSGCALQCFAIFHRGVDPDEFEHLHAGYCVAHGQVPYRDFFEHHAPALYYHQQPSFYFCGDHISVLWVNRLQMWAYSLGTLLLVWLIGRRIQPTRSALPAVCLLLWTTIFQFKGIELRPDVPATFLLCIAIYLSIAKPHLTISRAAAIGALVGLATAFTQKAIVPGAALFIGLVVQRLLSRQPGEQDQRPSKLLTDVFRQVCSIAIPFGVGFTAIGCILVAFFAAAGALPQFLDSTFFQLLRWSAYSDRTAHLRPTLAAELTVWSLAAWEIFAFAKCALSPTEWTSGRGIVVTISCFCAVSLFWVKATFPQYFFLWMPCLALLAGRRVAILLQADEAVAWSRGRCFLLVCLLGILQAALLFRAVSKGNGGSLAHVIGQSGTNVAFVVACVFVLTAILVASVIAICRNHRRAMVLLLAILGTYHGLLRIADSMAWSNAPDIAGVRAVNTLVADSETVLDGFTGYGALRPHAYYYWWINDYSLSLMSPDEKERFLLRHLKGQPPTVILYDIDLQKLPRTVTHWIEENYVPSAPYPIRVRKESQR